MPLALFLIVAGIIGLESALKGVSVIDLMKGLGAPLDPGGKHFTPTSDVSGSVDNAVASASNAISKTTGKVVIAAGAGRRPNKPVMDFLTAMAGLMPDGKVTVTTSTNHSKYTTSGTVSDHYNGNAADLGIAGNMHHGDMYASAALQVLGQSKSEADATAHAGKGTDFTNPHSYSWNGHRVQVGWRTLVGGNHFTHVHIGVA